MKPRTKSLKENQEEHKKFVQYVTHYPETVAYILSMLKHIYETHVEEALER